VKARSKALLRHLRLGLTQGTTAYTNASLKDVFFNKTQLLREGASNTAPQEADFNFSNVTLVPRFGTQAQAYVPGFDAVEEEVAVELRRAGRAADYTHHQ
jgi:predicted phage tail protein